MNLYGKTDSLAVKMGLNCCNECLNVYRSWSLIIICLFIALFQLAKKCIIVHGASRTDAGVHSYGQVAHFEMFSNSSNWWFLVNGLFVGFSWEPEQNDYNKEKKSRNSWSRLAAWVLNSHDVRANTDFSWHTNTLLMIDLRQKI